jgi:flavin-dependent dehydrogenase
MEMGLSVAADSCPLKSILVMTATRQKTVARQNSSTPMNETLYDTVIAGGGLAGLALSIQLAKAGYKVAVFEKEQYPQHKVCGEYISLESWNFLEELGLPLSDWNLPIIRRLLVSSPNGETLEQVLPLGGFGISRYKIDQALATIARECGIDLREQSKVTAIKYHPGVHAPASLSSSESLAGLSEVRTAAITTTTRIVAGAFGKRSNLDIRWHRPFTRKHGDRLNNYVGIKYHIRGDFPADQIALHNFNGGYCGLSRIEDDRYCLCYLTRAENLRANNNSIEDMEKNVLRTNPHLDRIFASSTQVFEQPLTISQISFEKKSLVEDHTLLAGDAAGMIAPLCGNGMSMALHASKLAFRCIDSYLKGHLERHEMEQEYIDQWRRHFGWRIWAGRQLQSLFGSESLTNKTLHRLRKHPKIVSFLIRQTHGQPF